MTAKAGASDAALAALPTLLPRLEALYKDVHAHPELSMQESRTAGLAADRLRAEGFEVTTGIGTTGVVGLLRNGEGPTVALRAGPAPDAADRRGGARHSGPGVADGLNARHDTRRLDLGRTEMRRTGLNY